jgi:adenylate kinase family enzyme
MSRYDRFMTRIVILGCAGSGKSSLAVRLGTCLDIPVISLDALWRPFARTCDVAGFSKSVESAHATPAWISDGNFADVTFGVRLPRADLVIWVDRARILCALRSIKRLLVPNPCHRIRELRTVLPYIASFDRSSAPLIEKMRVAYGANIPVRHLKSDRECAEFLATLTPPELRPLSVDDDTPHGMPFSTAA